MGAPGRVRPAQVDAAENPAIGTNATVHEASQLMLWFMMTLATAQPRAASGRKKIRAIKNRFQYERGQTALTGIVPVG